MSTPVIFAAGVIVTLIVAGAIALLFAAARLDGREGAGQISDELRSHSEPSVDLTGRLRPTRE